MAQFSLGWSDMNVSKWTLTSNPYADWLYSDWNEAKLKGYLLTNIGPIALYNDFLLDYRKSQEYLNRYGMDVSDIHDPRNLSVTGSASRVMNWVSSNITKLYR